MRLHVSLILQYTILNILVILQTHSSRSDARNESRKNVISVNFNHNICHKSIKVALRSLMIHLLGISRLYLHQLPPTMVPDTLNFGEKCPKSHSGKCIIVDIVLLLCLTVKTLRMKPGLVLS